MFVDIGWNAACIVMMIARLKRAVKIKNVPKSCSLELRGSMFGRNG